jgi:NAD(P)-dependent dehydrogenase (short-subunit alcohol dehydrogenase family)
MSTWLITGCSTGLGRALAQAALARGDTVAATARDAASIQQLVDAHPETALALPLDVTDPGQIRRAVREAQARFCGIDVLVNNAGHGYRAAVEEADDSDAQALFATNRESLEALLRGWLALPEDEPFDPTSLLFAVDAFPPATFDIEFSGWVPTLELTAYVRALPAPGPVRILQRAQLIDARRVDEACYVWDRRGRLVAHGSQLAGPASADHSTNPEPGRTNCASSRVRHPARQTRGRSIASANECRQQLGPLRRKPVALLARVGQWTPGVASRGKSSPGGDTRAAE